MATGDGHDANARPSDDDTVILDGAAVPPPADDLLDEGNAPAGAPRGGAAVPPPADALREGGTARAGALVDAPAEPLPEIAPPAGRPPVLRRKRRDLDRRRQRALLDLGGLVVEMARRERMRVD